MSGSTDLVTYPTNPAEIAETKAKYAALSCDTPAGYEQVRLAIAHVRTTRVAVEDRRVALKADALAYGRLVDSRAKEITALLVEIEEPLKAKKAAVDDEKARIKAEAEAEKLRALQAVVAANLARQEEEARAAREAEAAKLAEERTALEAERAKLEAEKAALEEAKRAEEERAESARKAEEERQRAEAERIAAEREAEAKRQEEYQTKLNAAEEARLAAERAKLAEEETRQKAEREKIEAERKAVAAEREKAERAEFERQAREKAEREAVEKIDRDRIAAERRAAEIAALRPDLEKIAAFSAEIRALALPTLADGGLEDEVRFASDVLNDLADDLDRIVEARRG